LPFTFQFTQETKAQETRSRQGGYPRERWRCSKTWYSLQMAD